jgi:hypothetical protein
MKFPTAVRYGARAPVELAAAYPDRVVSVREVGQRQPLAEVPGAHSAGAENGWFGASGARQTGRLRAREAAPEHYAERGLRAPRGVVGARRLCGLSRFVFEAGGLSHPGHLGRGERGGRDGAGADHDPGSLGAEEPPGRFVRTQKTESRLRQSPDGLTRTFLKGGPLAVATTNHQLLK